jgi:hypothetical protein
VRPGADRTGWPPDEAAAWDRLWAEVRSARDQAARPAPQAKGTAEPAEPPAPKRPRGRPRKDR